LSRAIRYYTVFDGFDNPALTPILHAMIIESSRPLAAVESAFAIDSSGFGSTKYARWFDAILRAEATETFPAELIMMVVRSW